MKKSAEVDMLNGTLWDKIPRFALPVAATAVLEQLFNAADLMVVGSFTGEISTIAVAAVGANSAIINLILNLFIGIALGVNVVIANAIGREDERDAQCAVHTAVAIAMSGGFIVAVLGELLAAPLLNVLPVPAEVLPYALQYLRIYLVGLPAIFLYNFEAAIFRSTGKTQVPLKVLAFSGILNVVLNLFFVIGIGRNVDGVAAATVCSNIVSAGVLFYLLLRERSYIQVTVAGLKFDQKSMYKIFQIGLPSGIQNGVFAVANIVIQTAINSLGTTVMAASSAAFNIEIIAYYVMNAFGQACTTFVGQNYGARQLDRCYRIFQVALLEDIAVSLLTISLILYSGRWLLSLFNREPAVIELGYLRLAIILCSYIFSMLYDVMSGYLRGFGISLAPAVLTMLGVCGTRIAWVYVIFPFDRTFRTILLAYPVSLSFTAILIFLALLYYRPSKRPMKGN